MIPSRAILKENLEERFQVLNDYGIKNLQMILDVLKTKGKMENFSKETHLPLQYLTILKREVSSYLPKPISLSEFPGVDSQVIKALENNGLKNTRQLFNAVKIENRINDISHSTGLAVEKLAELVSLSDLGRLYGVGPVFARIIYDVGIKSVIDFAKYKGEEFISIYEKETHKKADFSVNDINFSIELAKELNDS